MKSNKVVPPVAECVEFIGYLRICLPPVWADRVKSLKSIFKKNNVRLAIVRWLAKIVFIDDHAFSVRVRCGGNKSEIRVSFTPPRRDSGEVARKFGDQDVC